MKYLLATEAVKWICLRTNRIEVDVDTRVYKLIGYFDILNGNNKR